MDRIHHVGLTVTDLDRSLAWYRDLLGFEVLVDVEEADGARRKVIMSHADLNVRVGLVEHRGGPKARFDERNAGLDHLSFHVSPEDLPRFAAAFDEHGVVYTPAQPSMVNPDARLIVLRDPDNIQLELYAD